MTRSRQRKLIRIQQAKEEQSQQLAGKPEEELEPWPVPIYSKYFMAEFVEDDDSPKDPPSWCLYRLLDFVTPRCSPQPIWSVPEEDLDKLKELMARLDELQPLVAPGLKDETSKQADSAVA